MDKKGCEKRLESLREWYNRKSREFESSNYQKYMHYKDISSNIVKEYSEFERALELGHEMLKEKYSQFKYAKAKADEPNANNDSMISRNISRLTTPRSRTTLITPLEPGDLMVHAEDENENSSSHNEQTELYLPNLEFSYQKASTTPKFDYGINDVKVKAIFGDQEETLPTYTESQADINAKDAGLGKKSTFSTWLDYHSSFCSEIQNKIDAFERNEKKKEIRIHLSRTLADRINDCAKRNCTKQQLVVLRNFLKDLFEGKFVKSWKDGEEFQLDLEDQGQYFYAMATICDRYFELIKWDVGLMDQILLVILMLFLNQQLFYQVFCAKIVDSLTLINFNLEKILFKIKSFGSEHSEIASQWIAKEQAIFRLFCKVQLALEQSSETSPHKIRGIKLLKTILIEAIEAPEPTPLCTPFVLEEILNNFANQIMASKKDPNFGKKFSAVYIPLIKKNILKVLNNQLSSEQNFESKSIMISREKFLNGLLEDALRKI